MGRFFQNLSNPRKSQWGIWDDYSKPTNFAAQSEIKNTGDYGEKKSWHPDGVDWGSDSHYQNWDNWLVNHDKQRKEHQLGQTGQEWAGGHKYMGPAMGYNPDLWYKSMFAYDPQGARVEGDVGDKAWKGVTEANYGAGEGNYLGPSLSAQKDDSFGKSDKRWVESADARVKRIKGRDYWKEPDESALGLETNVEDMTFAGSDMRGATSEELKKQIASEFGTGRFDVGDDSLADITPWKDSPQATSIKTAQQSRVGGVGPIMTSKGWDVEQAFQGLDDYLQDIPTIGEGLDVGIGEDAPVPSEYWREKTGEQFGMSSTAAGGYGGLLEGFLKKIEGQSDAYTSANQEVLQAQQDITSKEREISDLERSKGEKAVETRKGLLGNVLESEERQYQSGLAGVGQTPAEQLGRQQLLEEGQVGLQGIRKGLTSEREGLGTLGFSKTAAEAKREAAGRRLQNPYGFLQESIAAGKDAYGPDWQTSGDDMTWWQDMMGTLGSSEWY